jgi:uncharacterized CHY-type Zn-finger protein
MKTSQADKWFSLCIRSRANWKCEACGRQYKQGDLGLHCSHFIGRGHYATRFEPLNAFAHCYGCHSKFEGNPHVFVDWVKSKRGIENYEIIIELSRDIQRAKLYRHADKTRELAAHYKAEFEKLEESAVKVFVGWL